MAYDKVVDSAQLDDALTATANAIRAKTGAGASIPWDLSAGFSSAIATIPSGGGTEAEDGFVTRQISGLYSNSRVTSVGDYAFYGCSLLTAVNLPAASRIGGSAFLRCSSLSTAAFATATLVGSYAFMSLSRMSTVSFPALTEINSVAFSGCGLTEVNFPQVQVIGSHAFYSCLALQTASFPAATRINIAAFSYCRKLVSFYLLGSSICSLAASVAFSATPIASYIASIGRYGSIFVPESLYSTYRTSAQWSYFSARFVSMTDAEIAALDGEGG